MPSAEPLAITALGMATPLGLGADATCAAIRAGLSRFVRLDPGAAGGLEGAEGFEGIAAPFTGLTDGYLGLGRFTRLAAEALRDLLAAPGARALTPGALELFLALPGAERESLDHGALGLLGQRLERWCQLDGLATRTDLVRLGHAGAIRALEGAERALRGGERAGVLVGGVDSLVEPATLAVLARTGRLKGDERPAGLIPGEAAAFVLVELLSRAQARQAPILAILGPASTATETVTLESDRPSDGAGLAQAMAGALGRSREVGLVISDLNGEVHRSEELALAATRALREARTPWRLWHPADAIGDTGAASAALALGLGARALANGYARTREALVCASSEGGLRGAVALRGPRAKE